MLAETRQVVRCWHPEAVGEHFPLKNGANVEVNAGEAAYQTSDGDIVQDF